MQEVNFYIFDPPHNNVFLFTVTPTAWTVLDDEG